MESNKIYERTDSQNRHRLKDFETELTVTKWETLEGVINWEFGVDTYTFFFFFFGFLGPYLRHMEVPRLEI